MSERTNPKGDPDAGIGSAGEPLTRTIELALRVQPAELTADSFKWTRRIKALAAALTSLRGTKPGKAVVDKGTVVNERVQGGPAKDESKQASSVSVHSPKDYSVTPESQIEATSTEPVSTEGEDTE